MICRFKRGHKVNAEVERICNFLSLQISYRVLILMLAVASAVQMVSGNGVVVTFWLLIVGIIIPLFAHQLRRTKDESGKFILTTLAKKYDYTEARYQSLSNAFLVEMLLLIIWQYTNCNHGTEYYIISIMPMTLIFVMTITRLGCYLIYRLLIKYKLKYNCL